MENFDGNEILGIRIGNEIRLIAEKAVRQQGDYHLELHDHLVEQAFVQVVEDLFIGLQAYCDENFSTDIFDRVLSSMCIPDIEQLEDDEDDYPKLVYKPPVCTCGQEKTLVISSSAEAWVCVFCTN